MRSRGTDAPKEDRVRTVEQRVMAEQVEQTLSIGNEQTSLMKDAQRTMILACGHECTLYAGMMSTSGCWSKRHTKCCECMHTATESPCIYIDGLGERPCPRWQFYCAACIRRCAPDDGTMWDAGKMTRVPVFEPGTRTLMSAAPNPVLAELAFELRQRLPIAVSRSINTPERISVLADQHFQMIEALKARDAATLRKLVWDHIAYAGD